MILTYVFSRISTSWSVPLCLFKSQSGKCSFSNGKWEGSLRSRKEWGQLWGTIPLNPVDFCPSSSLYSCLCFRPASSIASSEIFLSSPSLGQVILLNLSFLSALLSVWNYRFTCITYLSSVYPSNYLSIIYLSPKQTRQWTQWEEKARVLLLTIKSLGGLKCY